MINKLNRIRLKLNKSKILNTKGSLLLVAIFVVSMLSIIGVCIMYISGEENFQAHRERYSATANCIVESTLEEVVAHIRLLMNNSTGNAAQKTLYNKLRDPYDGNDIDLSSVVPSLCVETQKMVKYYNIKDFGMSVKIVNIKSFETKGFKKDLIEKKAELQIVVKANFRGSKVMVVAKKPIYVTRSVLPVVSDCSLFIKRADQEDPMAPSTGLSYRKHGKKWHGAAKSAIEINNGWLRPSKKEVQDNLKNGEFPPGKVFLGSLPDINRPMGKPIFLNLAKDESDDFTPSSKKYQDPKFPDSDFKVTYCGLSDDIAKKSVFKYYVDPDKYPSGNKLLDARRAVTGFASINIYGHNYVGFNRSKLSPTIAYGNVRACYAKIVNYDPKGLMNSKDLEWKLHPAAPSGGSASFGSGYKELDTWPKYSEHMSDVLTAPYNELLHHTYQVSKTSPFCEIRTNPLDLKDLNIKGPFEDIYEGYITDPPEYKGTLCTINFFTYLRDRSLVKLSSIANNEFHDFFIKMGDVIVLNGIIYIWTPETLHLPFPTNHSSYQKSKGLLYTGKGIIFSIGDIHIHKGIKKFRSIKDGKDNPENLLTLVSAGDIIIDTDDDINASLVSEGGIVRTMGNKVKIFGNLCAVRIGAEESVPGKNVKDKEKGVKIEYDPYLHFKGRAEDYNVQLGLAYTFYQNLSNY